MIEVLAHAIPVARIELLDDVQIDAVNRHFELELTVGPTLLLEFHGTPEDTAAQAKAVGEIADGARRAAASTGPPTRASGARSGTPATAPTRRAARCGPAPAASRPTPACRSRDSPSASPRPRPTSTSPACSRRSSATSATATSTSRSSSTRTTRTSWSAPRRSTTGSSAARSRWTAPAPANTASATARSAFLELEHGPAGVAMMRAVKSALDPDESVQSGQGGAGRAMRSDTTRSPVLHRLEESRRVPGHSWPDRRDRRRAQHARQGRRSRSPAHGQHRAVRRHRARATGS